MATKMDYFPQPEYNPNHKEGGNPLEVDVNAQYYGWEWEYVYQVILGCFVFLIIPGIGMVYGGLARRKSALTMMFQGLSVMAMVSFQWQFWGFTLAFSRTGGPFIGDMSNFGLINTVAAPSWGSAVIPDIVFAFYEVMFAATATMIVVGGSFERGRVLPSIIFGFCWCTICYCPIAYWTWNANGWLFKLGALDFAGGGPVHMSSGSAGLAYALVLGKRRQFGEKHVYKPHNVTIIFIGTVLIWFGWFGFNGGSALNASIRGMFAVWNTNMAASTGLLGWTMYHYIFKGRKFTVIGACEGVIAGLVGITPAAGYVNAWYAAIIGFVTAIVCCLSEPVTGLLRIDDGLEVFKLHGIAGACGAFLTGIFATASITALDGIPTIVHGAVDGNGIQIAYQLAEIAAICSWSFVISFTMLMILKYIPGMHLRVADDIEEIGLDHDQFDDETIGEWGIFDTEQGHARRMSNAVVHGVPVTGPSSSAVSTGEEKSRDGDAAMATEEERYSQ